MNERIKELAEQAGFYISKYFDGIGWVWCSDGYPIDEELTRFAELIRLDETKACAKHYLEIMRDAVEAARLEERAEILMALDSDLEHGVKWLSEKACAEFKKNCPELNKLLNSWSNHE